MALTLYERNIQRELETWQRGDESLVRRLLDMAMTPLDWVTEQAISPAALDKFDAAVEKFFSSLGEASNWTVSQSRILSDARAFGIDANELMQLRTCDMEKVDALARSMFQQNVVLAAVEGGGAGLGGVFMLTADLPLLFTINLRLIQQVTCAYGFDVSSEEFQPLVLAIFNAAASGTPAARHQALREVTVAASGLVHGHPYSGRVSGTFMAQNRHIPREIAKNLLSRKLAQLVPVAGAAIGAGVNYWFTTQTAETAYMLARALHVECKDRG
jgi:hypothetical protein